MSIYQGPIFVVGYSRSGTKFICNLLEKASGSCVEHLGELHFYGRISVSNQDVAEGEAAGIIVKLAEQYAKRRGFPYETPNKVAELIDTERLQQATQVEVLRSFFTAVAEDRKLRYVCDGTPRNAYYLPRILKDFSNARIIYMMRDPRDCILSQKQKPAKARARGQAAEARRLAYNYNPAVMARFWRSSLTSYESVADDPRVMMIRYEEMLNDPESTLELLSNFVDIPALEAFADQVRRGNSSKFSSGLARREVAAVEAAAGETMIAYGYEKTENSGVYRQLSYMGALIEFGLKLPLIYTANLDRFASVVHEIRTRLAKSKKSES